MEVPIEEERKRKSGPKGDLQTRRSGNFEDPQKPLTDAAHSPSPLSPFRGRVVLSWYRRQDDDPNAGLTDTEG